MSLDIEAHIGKIRTSTSSPERYIAALRVLWSEIEKWKASSGKGYSFTSDAVVNYYRAAAPIERSADPEVIEGIMAIKGEFAICNGQMILSLIIKE